MAEKEKYFHFLEYSPAGDEINKNGWVYVCIDMAYVHWMKNALAHTSFCGVDPDNFHATIRDKSEKPPLDGEERKDGTIVYHCQKCLDAIEIYETEKEKAARAGFDDLEQFKSQNSLETAMLEHWKKHGSLAGFSARAIK